MSEYNKAELAPSDTPTAQLLVKLLATILAMGSIAWSADLYREIGLVLLLEQFLAAMYGIGLALVFLIYPLKRKTEKNRIPWYDWLTALVSLITGWFVAIIFPDLQDRLPDLPLDGIIVSVIFIALSLEGLRRAAGYSLLIIVVFFIFYAMSYRKLW